MSRQLSVCVVTGSRAEYGLLFWTMKEIAAHPALQLRLVVTGMHLAPEFGDTWREIEQDGFEIAAKVDMLVSGDSAVATVKSTGLGVIGFADAFECLRPDVVLLLGDRFEILAAAQAAMLMRLPIAHIHGGEVTEGAVDEQIRHAVTKMAHLHFVAAEPYRRRVIQMGEAPDRVFTVGAPGIDNLARLALLDRKALAASLDVDLSPPLFLVTYHPATLGRRPPLECLKELLAALDAFPQARLLFTKANADAGGRSINQALAQYVAARHERAFLFASLGAQRYLSALALAELVIGNSSSGLVEAPSAGTVTIDIGDRQKGRLRADSVIDCAEDAPAIRAAIARGLDDGFQAIAARRRNPYGEPGEVARRIAEVLAGRGAALTAGKPFWDLPS